MSRNPPPETEETLAAIDITLDSIEDAISDLTVVLTRIAEAIEQLATDVRDK